MPTRLAVPVLKVTVWESFRGESGRPGPDLGDVLPGGVQRGGAQRHLREDVGLGDPPAKDISAVRRLFALILSVEGTACSNINMAFISAPNRCTNLPAIPMHSV